VYAYRVVPSLTLTNQRTIGMICRHDFGFNVVEENQRDQMQEVIGDNLITQMWLQS
jgi:hypothetical protein